MRIAAKVLAPVLRAGGFVALFYGLFLFITLLAGGGGWGMAGYPGLVAILGLGAILGGDQLKKKFERAS